MKFAKILVLWILGLALLTALGCSSEKKEEAVNAPQESSQSEQASPVMRCQEKFEQLDTNKDGKVSYEEFTAVAHPVGNPELIFKGRDKDADGFLTIEEFCLGKGMGRGAGARRQ